MAPVRMPVVTRILVLVPMRALEGVTQILAAMVVQVLQALAEIRVQGQAAPERIQVPVMAIPVRARVMAALTRMPEALPLALAMEPMQVREPMRAVRAAQARVAIPVQTSMAARVPIQVRVPVRLQEEAPKLARVPVPATGRMRAQVQMPVGIRALARTVVCPRILAQVLVVTVA